MTRSELAARLAEKMPTTSPREVEKIVAVIFEEISHALEKGKRVELRGFGAFSVKQRKERLGIDPRDGRSIQVGSRHVPCFRAGKPLLHNLNHNHR
ncbi:MAG: integration host factor subunit beta [Holosporaceae bacterium]|nr:MAG: integration host factor subunit beta [Holosporaceae bacterium]